MVERLSDRYERDERLHLERADALWSLPLVNDVVSIASPILDGASWKGVPPEAPARWSERSTAVLALSAIALRATRVITLTVSAGYSPEALPTVRRLMEAGGHAERVAKDPSGQYAANWLTGRGKSQSNRKAYGGASDDDLGWELMSGQAHASFKGHAALLAEMDTENRLIHRISPRRDAKWDAIWLWVAARHLGRVLGCVLKVHPQIDSHEYLGVMESVVAAEARISDELKLPEP